MLPVDLIVRGSGERSAVAERPSSGGAALG